MKQKLFLLLLLLPFSTLPMKGEIYMEKTISLTMNKDAEIELDPAKDLFGGISPGYGFVYQSLYDTESGYFSIEKTKVSTGTVGTRDGYYYKYKLTALKTGTKFFRVTLHHSYRKNAEGRDADCSMVHYQITVVELQSITLPTDQLTLYEGETYKFVPSIFPAGATSTLTWASSNSNVVSIASDGTATAKKAGTATITVTTYNNKQAKCNVTVLSSSVAVTGITLNKSSMTLNVGASETLSATVQPSSATNKNVTWKSSNTSVATVSSSGLVTGIKAGTATITCTSASNTNIKSTCNVTVKNVAVTGISLSPTSLSLNVGSSQTLTATVSPSNATDKSVTWSTSNSSIATVSSNGLVKGIKAGDATITCKSNSNSSVSKTCNVTVKNVAVTGLTLNKTSLSLGKGASETLTATITPSDATNKTVQWTSSDTSVATVNSLGKVTAINDGTATITCTSAENSSIKKWCIVTVISIINFADSYVKRRCVKFYDTDGDGELSIAEAAAVTDLNYNTMTDNHSIAGGPCTSFDELQYFTGITYIPGEFFKWCYELQSVKIPQNVKVIHDYAFYGCAKLAAINIPEAVTRIGVGAFSGCNSLTNVYITNLEAWCNISFEDSPLRYAHHLFINGQEVKGNLVIPNTITKLGTSTFMNLTGITSVTFHDQMTSINGFSGCTGLTSITIPNSVTSVDGFSDCTNLTSVKFGNSVQTIEDGAFQGCTGLTSLIIPEGVEKINVRAFYGCTNLTSISLPSTLTLIGQNAFNGCIYEA